jgi:hypothetical protein
VVYQKNLLEKEKLLHRVRKHGLNVRFRSGCGGEGEVPLVKHNMSGDKNPMSGEIVAAVPLMVKGSNQGTHNVWSEERAYEEQW